MSEKEGSTAFKIPDGTEAHVEQATQYGMVYPDGTVSWDTVVIEGARYSVEKIASGECTQRDRWRASLTKKAEGANISAYDYGNSHKVITRTVMLAVTEAVDHGSLRPWGALDGTPSAPPVPAPKPPWD